MKPLPNVVIIGGGTGTYVVGTGLTKFPLNLTAIVTVADNGGSTGRLRDEFGFLPVGDLRQALAAFTDANIGDDIRKLLLYRFSKGSGLEGHNLGNLILTALQDMTGSTPRAVEIAATLFRLKGAIYPITTKNIQLVIEYQDGTVAIGESVLDESAYGGKKIKSISTTPLASIYSKARSAILNADFIIIGPGDLYGSILPNLIIKGAGGALRQSKGKLIYNANLMSKFAQTYQMTIMDHLKVIEKTMNRRFDYIVINNTPIPQSIQKTYLEQHEVPLLDDVPNNPYAVIRADLLAKSLTQAHKADHLKRSFIRHDSDKIAATIINKIINP